ncbi:hypothetical protein WJX75_005806 [Coccomyxa subellipsoidea]|uniref:Purple acid phosphatase n=1 Tax=Coccomyxa subellipsoidea TaxID=248742 RepID=A0ABR2YE24_9CHLO
MVRNRGKLNIRTATLGVLLSALILLADVQGKGSSGGASKASPGSSSTASKAAPAVGSGGAAVKPATNSYVPTAYAGPVRQTANGAVAPVTPLTGYRPAGGAAYRLPYYSTSAYSYTRNRPLLHTYPLGYSLLFIPFYSAAYTGNHWAVYNQQGQFWGYDDGDTTNGDYDYDSGDGLPCKPRPKRQTETQLAAQHPQQQQPPPFQPYQFNDANCKRRSLDCSHRLFCRQAISIPRSEQLDIQHRDYEGRHGSFGSGRLLRRGPAAEGSDAGGSVWVSWATGTETFVSNPQAPAYPTNSLYAPQFQDPATVASVVEWSLTAGGPYTTTATGYARSYIQTYLHDGNTYVSNLLHHVHVTGIPYGQSIYYKCGDPSKEVSQEFSLTLPTSLKPKSFTYPMRLGVVADVGQTKNSSVTYQHLVANKPDTVVFFGDLSYSDDYNDRGVVGSANTVNYANTTKALAQTYQPRWATMARLLQNSGGAVSIPYQFLPGNHEIERDEYLRPFQSYTNRYRHSYEASYSQDPLYYSNDVGPIHVIMLNGYDSYLPNNTLDVTVNGVSQVLFGNSGGPSFPTGNYPQSTLGAVQLSWLLNDLARVNRAVTPWVVVGWHQPPYNSYSTHYKEAECLRQMVEPFLYNYGVDIVMHGHVHAYERTFQTLNYVQDGCAPRWLTMGDGGNQEGLYRQFAAAAGTCPSNGSPSACQEVKPNAGPQFCTTLQNGNYAPPGGAQPSYSAYREPSFGHGILTVLNSTVAQWQWFRNQDSLPVVTDSVYFVRNPACNNYSPGTPLPPPATTGAPASTQPPAVNPIQKVIDADKRIKGEIAGAILG